MTYCACVWGRGGERVMTLINHWHVPRRSHVLFSVFFFFFFKTRTAAEQRALVFMECEVIMRFLFFKRKTPKSNQCTSRFVEFIAWRNERIIWERREAHGRRTIEAAFYETGLVRLNLPSLAGAYYSKIQHFQLYVCTLIYIYVAKNSTVNKLLKPTRKQTMTW